MSTWEDLPAWTRSSGAGLAPAAGMVQSVLLAGMPRGCRKRLPPARQRKFKNEKLGSLLNSGSFPSDKGQVCIFLVIFDTVLNLGKTSSAQLWVGFDSASFGHVPSPSPHTCVSLQRTLRSCRPERRHRNDVGPFPGGTEIHLSRSCPGACTPICQRVLPKILFTPLEIRCRVGSSAGESLGRLFSYRPAGAGMLCPKLIPVGSAERCRQMHKH